MKYTMTVTEQTCHPMDYEHDQSTVSHSEWRDKHGAMVLWVKQWFKTQGANRTMDLYKFKTPKYQAKGRHHAPKEYTVAEVNTGIDVFGQEDWSEVLVSGRFDEEYMNVASYNRNKGLDAYHPEWGLRIINVYSKKRQEWKSLWVRVENDDGTEHISDD